MRIPLCLILFLTACAKAPAPGGTFVSKNSAAALAAFDDTRREKEDSLLRVAGMALRAGVSLDAARAERCWQEETRPLIKESCVLLWAGSGHGSSLLESAVVNGRTRLLSLALLQKRSLLKQIPYPSLLASLDALAKDALWVRADLTAAWLEAHGHPGLSASEALLSRIRPAGNSGPRDIASSLKAIRILRPGARQESLSSYCDSAAIGESRLRCWKVLGALGPEGAGLSHFLPSSRDQDWILFTRSFPRLAAKLQPALR